MIALWLALTAHGACPEPLGPDAVVREAHTATASFLAGDVDAGRTALLAADGALACVEGPLSPVDAGRLHVAHALSAFHAGDRRGATASLAEGLELAPDALPGEPPEDVAALVQAARAQPPAALTEFSTSLAAVIHVDGGTRAARHVGRPFVVQVFRPGGGVVGAAWVAAGQPVPDWVASPPVACATQVPVDDLVLEVSRAEAAFESLDVPAFERALQAIAVGLPCANGQVAQGQAAAIHRLEGMRQFVRNNPSQAIRAFQEAHALDPGYTPSEATVPPGSTLEALWERARTQPGSPWVAVDVPEGLVLVVDGLPSVARPAALPSIVQVASPSGFVLWTRFVPPGGALPDLEPYRDQARAIEQELLPPALAVYHAEEARRQRYSRRAGLILASAAALSGAELLYLANSATVAEYEDPLVRYELRPGLRRDANLTAAGGTVLLLAGGGLAVGAVFVR